MPVKNEERSVGPTLDAVFASTRLPDEIVIADGQSVDRTLERVEAYTGRGVPIRVVPNPQIFAGAGRNHAAAESVGGGIAHAGEGPALRRYEVVKIELADHSERTVYFDITENEKTWQGARPQSH